MPRPLTPPLRGKKWWPEEQEVKGQRSYSCFPPVGRRVGFLDRRFFGGFSVNLHAAHSLSYGNKKLNKFTLGLFLNLPMEGPGDVRGVKISRLTVTV